MTFTGEMSAADVGCPSKNIPRKVAPSGLMVALRLVDGKLACLVLCALHVFFDISLGEQMLEILGEFAFLVHVGCQ